MTQRTPFVTPAAVAVALLALVGCGSSGGDGAKPSSSPTPKALTAADAKTVAAAGVLTAADMPGYTAEAQDPDDADDTATDAAFRTCIGSPARDYLYSDPGRSFTKGDLEVDSSVDVARTAEIAKAELDAYAGPKTEACAKAEFTKLFAGEGGTLTSYKQTPVTVTVPGSDGTFGVQFTLVLSGGGESTTLQGYELGALVGQVEVALSVFGTPEETLTVEQAQALLVKAAGRVKAAL
jgi:hypothetical protein